MSGPPRCPSPTRSLGPLLALAVGAAGCGPANAQFQVERARPGAAHPAISVLGAFRDGRMSLDEWDRVGPAIAAALGAERCESAWGDRLEKAAPDDYRAIDTESREGGIGPELLRRVAPRAAGDAVMVIQVFGRPRERRSRARSPGNPGTAAVPTGRRGGGFAGRRGPAVPEEPAFEVGATVIDAAGGAVLARVDMRYTGNSRDEALQLFTDRLKAELPGATCAGWHLER